MLGRNKEKKNKEKIDGGVLFHVYCIFVFLRCYLIPDLYPKVSLKARKCFQTMSMFLLLKNTFYIITRIFPNIAQVILLFCQKQPRKRADKGRNLYVLDPHFA